MEPLKISTITFGELQEHSANAITWEIKVQRGAEVATAICSLVTVHEDGSSIQSPKYFEVQIPKEVLQLWGKDDSVIDEVILKYSPMFQKI